MSKTSEYYFSSESVTEGHPDKLADQISDSILDEILTQDPNGRVACEVLVTTGLVVIAGEITTQAYVDLSKTARKAIFNAGYNRPELGFDSESCGVMVTVDEQSTDIANGINLSFEARSDNSSSDHLDKLGAGDQGIMFGFACLETETFMPMPIFLANRLAEQLARVRKDGEIPYLRPDGKVQVTFKYEDDVIKYLDTVLISTQHDPDVDIDGLLRADLIEKVIKPVVPEEVMNDNLNIIINPSGSFIIGGPVGDAGLTGRKVIVDTYGGSARHGGGAFSGKDPSKVDRSASYAARWVAKNLVAAEVADKCEVQIAYGIGMSHPISVMVETFGTARVEAQKLSDCVNEVFDLRPAAIIADLNLSRPIYTKTATYGHFGRDLSDFNWERLDKVKDVKAFFNL